MDIIVVVDNDYPKYRRCYLEHSEWTVMKIHKGTPWKITNIKIVAYSPCLL